MATINDFLPLTHPTGAVPYVTRTFAPPELRLWSLDYLLAEAGDAMVRVISADGADGRLFLDHARRREASEGLCSLREYVDYISTTQRLGEVETWYYLAAELAAFAPHLLAALPPALRSALTVPVWVGTAGTSSGIHIDRADGFHHMFNGAKRFLLFAPDEAKNLYHPLASSKSPIDPRDPDFARYPNYADAVGYQVTINEGDTLFFPAGWYHHVESVTPITGSLTFFYDIEASERAKRPSLAHLTEASWAVAPAINM